MQSLNNFGKMIIKPNIYKSVMFTKRLNHTRAWKRIVKRDDRPIIQSQRLANIVHEQKAQELGLNWRIVGST